MKIFSLCRLAYAALLAIAPSMALAAQPAVHGCVLSPAGSPVPGTRAELLPLLSNYEQGRLRLAGGEPSAVAVAATDPLGRYVLTAPGPGVFIVRLTVAGRVPLQSGPLPLVGEIELPAAVPPPDAGGRLVLRTAAGIPRSGLSIFAAGDTERSSAQPALPGGWRTAPRVGRTAGEGSLTLPRSAGESLTLHVFSDTGAEEVHRGWTEGPVTVRPEPAAAHRLRVVDPRGEPVPGVLVRRGEMLWPVGLTNSEGRVEIASAAQRPLRIWLITADGRQQAARLAPPGAEEEMVVLQDALHAVGRVTAAESGRPISGSLVWSSSDPGRFQLTDAEGRYRWPMAAAGSAWLEARTPGRLPKRMTPSPEHIRAGRLPTLALDGAAALSGRVVDAAGRGLTGAWISASTGPGEGFAAGASSGENGAFELSPLRFTELYELRAVKSGFLPAQASAVTPRVTQRPVAVSLVLLAARPAVGRVQDAAGHPVAGAEIQMAPARSAESRQRPVARRVSGDGEPQAVSDEQGRFQVAEIPALALDVAVTRPGFARAELRGFQVPPGSGPVDLGRITLQPGARVEGRVVDGEGGPLAGAAVFRIGHLRPPHELADQLREQKPDAITAADGRFLLTDLAKGEPVHLLVSASGFLPVTARGIRPPLPKPLLIRLEAGATFAGRVIDEEERPVPGAGVVITWKPTVPGHERLQAGTVVSRHATTDRQGFFEIPNLPLGRVELAVDASGYTALRGVTAFVPLPPGEELTFRLTRGATLSGRVTTRDGDPVSGVRILVGSAAGISDDEGAFLVGGVQPGPQLVEARHPHYERLQRDMTIEPGVNHLDLTFAPGREIRGRVVSSSGEPIPGAGVVLGSTAPQDARRYRGRADPEGGFLLAPVGRGTYRLEASARGYARGGLDPVQVDAEPVEDLTVVLQPGGAIRGRVLGLKAEELSLVVVRAEHESGDARLAEMDASGSYLLDDLESGDWMIQASLSDGQREVQARVPLAPGGEVVRDLEFGGRLLLTGQILYRDEPLADTHVSIRGVQRAVQRFVDTNYEGRFRFEDLEADTYWLGLSNPRELVVHNQKVEVAVDRDVTIRIERSDVAGTVIDAVNRQPLADAVVALRHVAAGEIPEFLIAGSTDARGAFELPQVPPGRYLLQVTREGYSPDRRDVEVAAGRDMTGLEVPLEPTPGIELAVRLASGRRPALLHLRLLSSAGQLLLADTRPVDQDGRVRLSSVPPGAWTLLAAGSPGALTARSLVVPSEAVSLTLPDAAGLAVRVNPLATSDTIATLRLLREDGRALEVLALGGMLEREWLVIGGKAVVTGVPAGHWIVQVASTDGRAWTGTVATDGLHDAAVTLD